MTMVLPPGESVDDLVATGNGSCPGCAGTLRPWGRARVRVMRVGSEGDQRVQPHRVRCRRCGITQVVLPAEMLVRRRDAVKVVGEAWRSAAAGAGSRRVGRVLGVPTGTVRGWLRRLRALARDMYSQKGGSAQDHLRSALAFVVAEAGSPGRSEADLWRFVNYRSQGRLLCNTSWP